jgi:hypothetical protein
MKKIQIFMKRVAEVISVQATKPFYISSCSAIYKTKMMRMRTSNVARMTKEICPYYFTIKLEGKILIGD